MLNGDGFFIGMYYVYIIQSEKDFSYYKGMTTEVILRLKQHNEGGSKYTSLKLPWKLVYVEKFSTKRLALIRERAIKKYGVIRIEQLKNSARNIYKEFI